MKSLEQMVRENAEFAASTFKDTGSLTPMWIAECENGDILPIVAPMTDKDKIIAAVKALFREHKVKRYVFMCEAWTIVGKSLDEARNRTTSLEHHPNRREIIMVSGEDGKQTIMGHMFILRPEHGKPTVSPFTIQTMDRAEGRMTGLLPEKS